MSANLPRYKALAAIAVTLVVIGSAAMFALSPAEFRAGHQPELVKSPPKPVSASTVQPAAELGDAFIAISEAVTPAVVRIEAEYGGRTTSPSGLGQRLQDIFGGTPTDAEEETLPEVAGGSGFIVSADGYILTNHHVIEDATRITVSLADKRTFNAEVVGSDPLTDIAVIRIPASGLPAVPLGDSDSTRVGEWVLAIGNPGFDGSNTLDFTVTGGIISAKGRGLEVLAAADSSSLVIEDFLQTDAVINPGNSGGPLVNLHGGVIGINTAIATTTGTYQGYGFAIPSNLVRRVMRDLVQYGFMRRALLGVEIEDVTAEDAEVYGLTRIAGVVVQDFTGGSSAERSGLQRNDVIVSVDGKPADRVGQLQQLVAEHDPGTSVTLGVVRYGRPLEFRVPLQEAEHGVAPRRALARPAPVGLGIEVRDLDPELADRLGYRRSSGAVISRVVPGSAADQKQVDEWLRIVAIDRQAVPTAKEARRLLREVRPGRVVSLLLANAENDTFIYNIRVP